MEAQQDHGHPLRRQDLQVCELSGAVGRRGECHARADPGDSRPRQPVDQEAGEPSGERVRQQETRVVRQQRRAAEELNGRREDTEASQVFGEGEHPSDRYQHRGTPPGRGEGNDPRVPPQDPCVEDRIPEIVRNSRTEVRGDGPGPDDGEEHEAGEGEEVAAKSQVANGKWEMALRFFADCPIDRIRPSFSRFSPPIAITDLGSALTTLVIGLLRPILRARR